MSESIHTFLLSPCAQPLHVLTVLPMLLLLSYEKIERFKTQRRAAQEYGALESEMRCHQHQYQCYRKHAKRHQAAQIVALVSLRSAKV